MRQHRLLSSLVAVSLLLLTACGGGEDAGGPAETSDEATSGVGDTGSEAAGDAETAEPVETRKISVILDWVMEASYAQLLYGQEHGFFADAGLEVDIIGGQGSDLAMSQINEGQVDFAFTDLETYLIQRAEGQTDTTAVYAWLNEATIGVVSREPIESPAGMEGLTWGTVGFSSGRVVLPFVLEQNGVDPDAVTIELMDFGVLYPSLFEGAIDAAEAHIPGSWEGVLLAAEKQGLEVSFVPLSEWGLKSYSKLLIVPNETLRSDPDLVERFVGAIHRSMTEAMANASGDEIFTLLREFDPQAEEDQVKLTWDNFRAVVTDPGPLDPDVVQATLDRLAETQGLEADLTPEELIDNSFIP